MQAAPGSIGLIEGHADPPLFSPHAAAIEASAFKWYYQSEVVRNPGQTWNIQGCSSFRHISDHAAEGTPGEFYHAGLQYPIAMRSAFFHGCRV
jgi:hypothetical protein